MTDTLTLTGWGWKEYAVAAAVVLKAHHGDADVVGVSKRRRFSELLEEFDVHYKKISHGTTPVSGLLPEDLEEAMHFHVHRIYEKCGQNLTKAAAVLKVTRNTVRKYLK